MTPLSAEAVRRRAVEIQRRAAEPAHSVWVTASAGTGKTTVLTDRALRLLMAGCKPERLLALTFTKAAAAEMANRIAERLALWATIGEVDLARSLDLLLGRGASDEERGLARRLFARVLDTPGGMRIMTIHAFCQSLLRRFPLEAGIAPHFELLDERGSAELLAEAQEEMLEAAAEAESGPLAGALSVVNSRINELDFADLLAGLIRARGKLDRLIQRHGALEAVIAATKRKLGLAPEDDEASLLAAGVAEGQFDRAALAAAAAALARSSKSDQPRGERLAGWLAADADARVAAFEIYAAIFLPKEKDRVRARLAASEARKLLPRIDEILTAEAERVLRLCRRLAAARLAEATAALMVLGADILERYRRLKEERAALDYEDLILSARWLLERPGIAPWVLYKLDGGLDHILLDEAQDTSPAQWEIVARLAEEFFVGETAQAGPRTVFAVGDAKQSIFAFQGADPAAFADMRRHFAAKIEGTGSQLQDVPLDISFRSTEAVLQAVDAVFALPEMQEGVALDGRVIAHSSARPGQAGRVEVWPLAEPLAREAAPEWRPLRERRPGDSPRERLARLIAERIAGMLARGERLESRGRPLRPGDFLILVRHRDALVEDLVREMKKRGVPVAGVDRMRLMDQLAVQDLVAWGRFLLLPEDDFNLAVLLKSPLVGLGEDDLFALATGRENRSLWEELQRRPEFAAARELLSGGLARADFLLPHELYADLLGRLQGRARLLGRLGPDVADPLSEFVNLALAYEREHVPSLQGFLHWLERDEGEIKRESEPSGAGLVRIMTVHGAKGLQAPIVFLPDTLYRSNKPERLFWLPEADGGFLFWPSRVEDDDPLSAAARAAGKMATQREERRLLYVALTRAEDRLYVCGWQGGNPPAEDCWYRTILRGLDGLAKPVPFDSRGEFGRDGWIGEALLIDEPQRGKPEADSARFRGTAPIERAPEAWIGRPPAPEPLPGRPLSPSRLGDEPAVSAPLAMRGDEQRFRRGRLIHRMLQSLPDLPVEERSGAAARFLASRAQDLSQAAREEIAAETLRLLADPVFAALFGPGSRAEVPILGKLGPDTVIAGQIDRLLVTPCEVLVVDYKTNRPAPRTALETPQPYLRQMAAYRMALGKIYLGKSIRCALLWTEEPRLMALPEDLLQVHSP